MTAIRASRTPARGHELLEDRALAKLVLGAADDHEGSLGMASEARAVPECAVEDHRRLVVMRHAKAEQAGPTDFERPLAARVARRRRGRAWLAAQGVDPDHALVSAARAHAADVGRASPRAPAGSSSRRSTRACTPPAPRPRSTWCARPTDDVTHAGGDRAQPDDGLAGAAAGRRRGRRRRPATRWRWATPPARSPSSRTTAPGRTSTRPPRARGGVPRRTRLSLGPDALRRAARA